MKILVISQYYSPEQFRVNDICEELIKRGHMVTVVTGLPNYPEGEIYNGYENKANVVEFINGVKVCRCKLRPRHKGTFNLLLNYWSFVINSIITLNQFNEKYDIIYVYGVSPVTQAIAAIHYKHKFGTPIYYYCCDLWPESVRGEQNGHKQIAPCNPIYIIAKAITCKIYSQIDAIGCKCKEFVEYNSGVCKVPLSKMCLLYEHAESTYLSVAENPIDNGTIDFAFLGNIGRIQNCDQIIMAVSKLSNSNKFHFHFIGDGSELNSVKKLAHELKVEDKVTFYGRKTVDEVIEFYNLADVCILTLSNRTQTGLTLPAKLPSYMASCRPIIGAANGATRSVLMQANCGFTVAADDVKELVGLLQKVIDFPDMLDGLGNNGRKFFMENFTLKKHVDELEKQLETLCIKSSKEVSQ